MKKFAAILSALILSAAVFAGCGKEVSRVPSDKPAITVRYYYAGYGKTYMEKLADDFNARAQKGEYDFYVNPIPDTNISESIKNLLENPGLAVPDIAIVNSFPSTLYGRRGNLALLNDLYATEVSSSAGENGKQTVADKMYDRLLANYNVEGNYYGLPIQSGVTGILYNVELFEQYSLPLPETMKELWDLLARVDNLSPNTNGSTEDDIYSFTYASNAAYYWDYLAVPMFLQLMGEDAFYDMYNVESIADAEASWSEYRDVYMNVYENIAGLKEISGKNRLTTGSSHTGVLASIAQKRALMTPCGDWGWVEIAKSLDPSKVDLLPAPLACDPQSGLVIARATPSTEVLSGVDRADAAAVAEAEKGYFKIPRNEVSGAVVPEEDAAADYVYFRKYTYSMAGQMEAVIPEASANKEKAAKFLAYLASDEGMAVYTEYTGSNMPFEGGNTDIDAEGFYPFNKHALELGKYGVSIVGGATSKPVRYGFAGMLPGDYTSILTNKKNAVQLFDLFMQGVRDGMDGLDSLIANYEAGFVR